MSEQYRCKSCGYVFDMKDMMCSECGIGYFERLHWTKGGDGSHWEGCADVHWDCRIAQHYYKDELYLDEDLRMLAKTYPADVSAIGVTVLIDYVEALEAELAVLKSERRWIPVSERLPKEEGQYLVIDRDGDMQVADRVISLYRSAWSFQADLWVSSYVTHWMPPPADPPSEEE